MPSPFYSTNEWRKLRATVKRKWKAQGRPCAYCGQPLNWSGKPWPIADHIQNRKQFPHLALVESNIAVVCHVCNSRKHHHVENNDKPEIGVDGLPVDGSWK